MDTLPPVVAILRANISQFRAGMAEAQTEMAKVEGASAKMSAGISRAGKASALGLAGIGVYAVHLAGNFQQATNVLVTAAGETESGLKIVRDGIKSVALQTGVSFGQLEQGSYVLEKAGYRGANAVSMLRVASQGAREENANLGTVINAMTSVMASYHLKTADAVRVMNALKTGAGEAKTTMEDYAGALSTVLPIASAAHISFADIAGAFATLTQHGTTAQESTQELASTIRALQAPAHTTQVLWQQLGLSVNDVSQNIGKRGLTGTLDLLYAAIMQHMGPSGLVLMNAFNQSKTAAQDANIMIGNMPANLQKVAKAFRDGQLTTSDWRKELKALPVDQANLLRQFAALENHARGFSDQLKSGGPAAQTFTAVLRQATGGAIGLNTALQLTGENMQGTKDRVDAVSKSFNDSGKDVEGWKTTMGNVNTALGQAKNALELIAMDLGNVLIPAVTSASTFIAHHKTLVEGLATVFGVVLVAATVAWVGKLAWAAAESAMSLGRIVARVLTTQTAWVGLRNTEATTSAAGAAAVARGAAVEETALTTVGTRILTLEEQFWGLAAVEAKSSAAGSAAIARNAAVAETAMVAEGNTAMATGAKIRGALAGIAAGMGSLAMLGVGSMPDLRSTDSGKPVVDAMVHALQRHNSKAAKDALNRVLKSGSAMTGAREWLLQYGGQSKETQAALSALGYAPPTAAQLKAAQLQRDLNSDNPNVAKRAADELAKLRHAASSKHGTAGATPSLAALLHQLDPNVAAGHAGGYAGIGAATKKKVDPLAGRRAGLSNLLAAELGLGHKLHKDAALAKAGKLSPASAKADQVAAKAILAHAKALEKSTRGTTLHTQAVREVIKAHKELGDASKLLAASNKKAAAERAKQAAAAAEAHRRDIADNMFSLGLVSSQAEQADLTKRMEGLEKYSDEWTRLYQERQQLIDAEANAQIAAQDKVKQAAIDAENHRRTIMDNEFTLGLISAQQEEDDLTARMAGVEQYSDEWMRLYQQRQAIIDAQDQASSSSSAVGASDPGAIGSLQSMLAMLNPGTAAGMAMLSATFNVDGQALFTALQPHVLQYENRNGNSGVVAA